MKAKKTDVNFNFSIKTPCSQSFKNFKKTDKGGFCKTCNKEVIDFRNFTDKELEDFFKNENKKICGLLLNNQISRYSDQVFETNDVKKHHFKTIFGFSILTLFSFNHTYSQKSEKDSIGIEVKKTEKPSKITNIANQKITQAVIYNRNGPLPGVGIVVKNKDLKTITDNNGRFSFHQKLNKNDVLIISYIGHITRELKISDILENKIMLQEYTGNQGFTTLGEINIKKVYHSKTTFFQKIKNLFK